MTNQERKLTSAEEWADRLYNHDSVEAPGVVFTYAPDEEAMAEYFTAAVKEARLYQTQKDIAVCRAGRANEKECLSCTNAIRALAKDLENGDGKA